MADKNNGELWDSVTKETLMELAYEQNLTDRQIAELYGVTINKVRYKRYKFGVTLKNKLHEDLLSQKGEDYDHLNTVAKKELLKPENIDGVAKALTQHVFRSGPVEDMHAAGKLTQEDMKTLNKFMVNRLAGVLSAIHDERWLQLSLLFAFLYNYSTNWDPAEPDIEFLEISYFKYFGKTDT